MPYGATDIAHVKQGIFRNIYRNACGDCDSEDFCFSFPLVKEGNVGSLELARFPVHRCGLETESSQVHYNTEIVVNHEATRQLTNFSDHLVKVTTVPCAIVQRDPGFWHWHVSSNSRESALVVGERGQNPSQITFDVEIIVSCEKRNLLAHGCAECAERHEETRCLT